MWSALSCEVHRNPRLCPLGPLCDAPSAAMKAAARPGLQGERRVVADGRSAQAHPTPSTLRPGTTKLPAGGVVGGGLRGKMSSFPPGSYPGTFHVCLKHTQLT